MGYAFLCLADDFRAGGVIVGVPVGRIVVLVCVKEAFRVRSRCFACVDYRAVRAVHLICQHQFGPENAQRFDSFRAGVFRQAQGDFVAARGCESGVRDAHVAGCGIQQRHARRELAGVFGLADDEERRAIFD